MKGVEPINMLVCGKKNVNRIGPMNEPMSPMVRNTPIAPPRSDGGDTSVIYAPTDPDRPRAKPKADITIAKVQMLVANGIKAATIPPMKRLENKKSFLP